jgi:hypothetical protein
LNGIELKRFYLLHNELFSHDALLEFEMTGTPVIK